MPGRKPMGRIPIIFGDLNTAATLGQIYEAFLDYDSADLWYIGTDGRTLIPITKNIKEMLNKFEQDTSNKFDEVDKTIETTTDNLTKLIQDTDTTIRKDLQVRIWRYTIPANAGWAGSTAPYTLNIALSNMKNTWLPKMYLEEKEATIANRAKVRNEYGKISLIDSYNGGVTLTCDKFKPMNANIPIRIEVQNSWV